MGGKDKASVLFQHISNRRKRGLNAHIVRDFPVSERNIEVDAHEDAFAGEVEIGNR